MKVTPPLTFRPLNKFEEWLVSYLVVALWDNCAHGSHLPYPCAQPEAVETFSLAVGSNSHTRALQALAHTTPQHAGTVTPNTARFLHCPESSWIRLWAARMEGGSHVQSNPKNHSYDQINNRSFFFQLLHMWAHLGWLTRNHFKDLGARNDLKGNWETALPNKDHISKQLWINL